VARILIVGGGCRGRALAAQMVGEGHAVRITTRTEAGRSAIEATGAECFVGTPDRLATLRAALESVTIVCWLMGTASGDPQHLRALHSSRLRFFLAQVIDTTVRGFLYEASGSEAPRSKASGSEATRSKASGSEAPCSNVSRELLAAGEEIVRALGQRNAIPVAILADDPGEGGAWLAGARDALDALLGGRLAWR
jgi:nucleoside-diphosphate-sugar epimerase